MNVQHRNEKEGSHSGLVHCLGKAASGKPDQEFKSPTLRRKQILKNYFETTQCFYVQGMTRQIQVDIEFRPRKKS